MNTDNKTMILDEWKDKKLEELLEKLEDISQAMDHEDTPLEEAFAKYQEGVALVAYCNQKIEKVEHEIKVLEGGQA